MAPCLAFHHDPNNMPNKTSKVLDQNHCAPAQNASTWYEKVAYCPNTINGENACDQFQYQNGEYRLNTCLQCDECRSGPIF